MKKFLIAGLIILLYATISPAQNDDDFNQDIIGASPHSMVATTQPPPPHPPPPPPPPPSGFPPETRREAWKKIMKEYPEDAQRLLKICKDYPELGCGPNEGPGRPGMGYGPPPGHGMGPGGPGGDPDDAFGPGMGPPWANNPTLLEKYKKIKQLRSDAFELSQKYQDAESDADKSKIEGDIRKILDEIYTIKLEVTKARIKQVEDRLASIKIEMQKYEKDKPGVINSWLEQLTGRSNYKKF